MTIRQAAIILGIKPRTIREWIKTGRLKAIKGTDNAWHIPEGEVYRKETQERADKGREHSARIKEGIELGMLQRGQNT